MIKVILFDCDGPIIKRTKYFSQRIEEEKALKIDHKRQKEFFDGEFLECEVGKKDLKEILPAWLPTWGWQGTVEELLKYWFEGEAEVDIKMLKYIKEFRNKDIKCYLTTNQEKYRAEYLWNVVGLNKHLDDIFASCYVGYMKPKKEFWQEVSKNFSGINKSEVLVLDDDQDIVKSAQDFGFNAEFYTDFNTFRNQLTKYEIFDNYSNTI